eukprot:jgi/Ulvmu1/8725/UM047_0066.1
MTNMYSGNVVASPSAIHYVIVFAAPMQKARASPAVPQANTLLLATTAFKLRSNLSKSTRCQICLLYLFGVCAFPGALLSLPRTPEARLSAEQAPKGLFRPMREMLIRPESTS